MRGIIAALALLGAAALSGSALGAETIAYQGRLASNSGGDPPSGTYLMQFSLFPFEGGGEPLWAETRTVPVEAGLYTVELGGVTPFADQLFADNPNLWLETALDSSGNGVFETTEVFTPRVKLTAAPYAFAGADGGTVGGGVEVEPNTPPASVQRLAREYVVGDGSVGLGNLVALYADGKVRQSGSRLPWAKDEVPVPGSDTGSIGSVSLLRHYALGSNQFLVHWSTPTTLFPLTSSTSQVAGRFDPETLEVSFGEAKRTSVSTSYYSRTVPPASVVLNLGDSDEEPLIASAMYGTESYYGVTLTSVDPETLAIHQRSTPFITQARYDVNGSPFAIAKIDDSTSGYTIMVGGHGGIVAYTVEKSDSSVVSSDKWQWHSVINGSRFIL